MSHSNSGNQTTAAADVAQAVEAFRHGQSVCIHDAADREGETDIVYPAGGITQRDVARLRNDAGGLICVAISDTVAQALDLPFVQDIVDHPLTYDHDLSYDDRSSFSLTVNHQDTRTGITDEDRALTIRELSTMADDPDLDAFAATFRAPGHVHLLRGAPNLLEDREGHTELGLALADAAGLPPAVTVCEMLNDETGRALSATAAQTYALRQDIPYLEGETLCEEFRQLNLKS